MNIHGPNSQSILRLPWPVSRLLILLVVAVAFPLFIIITWAGYHLVYEKEKELNEQTIEIANRISSDVDLTLANYTTILKTLAVSPALATNNFLAVYEQARSALAPVGLFVCLHRPDGEQIFNTRVPFGSPLPASSNLDQLHLTSEEPHVSDVIVGNVAKEPVIAVGVPIIKDGKLVYALSLSIDLALFKRLLDRQHLPRQWMVSIVDRKGTIIARSHRNDEFQGKPIPRRDVHDFGISTLRVTDLEGDKVILTRRLSQVTGWGVGTLVPVSIANAEIHEAILRYLALVGIITAIGIVGALYVGRLIVGPLQQVKKAAEALGTGDTISTRGSLIQEAQAAIEAFAHSAEERKQVERILQKEMQRFTAAEEGAGGFVYDWDAVTDHAWRSEGFTRMLGWKPDEFPSTLAWRQLLHPEDREEFDRNGRVLNRMELRVRHRDGHYLWVWDRGRVFRNEQGVVIGKVGSVIDITHRKMLEERQALLLNELSHRSKNLLGVIQAIAMRTLASSCSTSEVRDALAERLESLGRTYDTLTQHPTYNAPIAKIVNSEISAFADRIQIDGPDLLLNPTAAQTLALIVHELATNAAKYGALSVREGTVFVRWGKRTFGELEYFHFSWRESGGPPVTAPSRRGFGSVLTDEVASHQFDGKVSLEFLESGVDYKLVALLRKLAAKDSGSSDAVKPADARPHGSSGPIASTIPSPSRSFRIA